MTKYYKGTIVEVESKKQRYKATVGIVKIKDTSPRYYLSIKPFFDYELVDGGEEIMDNYLKLANNEADDDVIKRYNDFVIKLFKSEYFVKGTEIIYTKVYDNDGNAYGIEIKSGRVFPLIQDNVECDVIYSICDKNRIFFDEEGPTEYTTYIDRSFSPSRYYLKDTFTNKLDSISYSDFKELHKSKEEKKYDWRYCGSLRHLHGCYPLFVNIYIDHIERFKKGQIIKYAIANEKRATQKEADDYKEELSFFQRRRAKKNYKAVVKAHNANIIDERLSFSPENPFNKKKDENKTTKEMQEVEFLLLKLKNVSLSAYEELSREYERIIDSDKEACFIDESQIIEKINELKKKIDFALTCNNKTILEYLKKQMVNYLENYKNNFNSKTSVTISEVDRICAGILSNKDSFSFKEQNELLRNIALLYFFEIYINKDELTEDDLESSYVSDNIKRIIMVITALKEVGIIKELPNGILDINNVRELLKAIKNIKFNFDRENLSIDAEELVKKIKL